MILAGDIGGTNTRLAVFGEGPLRIRPEFTGTFPSQAHAGIEDLALEFLARLGVRVEGACFGIAGPVRDGRCEATNLPWVVDARQVASRLGCDAVQLVNDLEACAHGIAVLQPADVAVLNEGKPDNCGTRALIAAGTGLGEAGLVLESWGYRPVPSEGGHSDFAPRNELEIELLRFLIARHGHVSYERIISGPGLQAVYEFLRDTGRGAESPALAAQIAQGDAPAVISKHGVQGTSELCVQALDLFVSVYASEAGNLALKFLATGGLYIGGGIAPKIIGKLREPAFLKSFLNKGRLSKVVEDIPVRVILDENAPLLGAGNVALTARTS